MVLSRVTVSHYSRVKSKQTHPTRISEHPNVVRGTPPGILHEYQNKGVAKFDCCKCMKRKGEIFHRRVCRTFGRSRQTLPYLVTSLRPYFFSKSFKCNTYRPPRKCCKQKTYGSAKFKRSPVDATLIKNRGGTSSSHKRIFLSTGLLIRSLPR